MRLRVARKVIYGWRPRALKLWALRPLRRPRPVYFPRRTTFEQATRRWLRSKALIKGPFRVTKSGRLVRLGWYGPTVTLSDMEEAIGEGATGGERARPRQHWILNDEGEAVEFDGDFLTWARWYETAQRQLANDQVGDVRVSTIFLGLDHNFGMGGPPLLFETTVFGDGDDRRARYATRTEALRGHAEILADVLRFRKARPP